MIKVCPLSQVDKGTVAAFELAGTPVAVVHTTEGEVFAAYDECSHAQVALSEGEVDGCTLECWLHGSRFDLRTGQPSGPPAFEPVPVYPVEVRDGEIYVELQASNGVSW